MTRASEVLTTSAVAAATSAIAMIQADMSGIMIPVVSGVVAALVGYFSAQITVRSELASLSTDIKLLRAEMHRYYLVRGGAPRDEDDGA